MRQILKAHLRDCSDAERFCHAIRCAECHRVWESTPIRFSKAGEELMSEEKRIIAETLYQRERTQSLDRAVSEAVHHFNSCPVCDRLVCNYCFVICDDLDLCRACAGALKEKGESVLDRLSED